MPLSCHMLGRSLVVGAIILLVITSAISAQPTRKVTKLADGVYAIEHAGNGGGDTTVIIGRATGLGRRYLLSALGSPPGYCPDTAVDRQTDRLCIPGHDPILHDKTHIMLIRDLRQNALDQMNAYLQRTGPAMFRNLDEVKGEVNLSPFRRAFGQAGRGVFPIASLFPSREGSGTRP